MSLIDEMTDDYILLNKVRVDDGIGGYDTQYTDGVPIKGAMVFDTSIQARIADAQGVSSVYTLTTKKNIVLEYHDVLRRVRDGKIFRVTSDGDDKYTPPSATLNMRQVTCEEWTLPGGNA
jgi:hypothetical protein